MSKGMTIHARSKASDACSTPCYIAYMQETTSSAASWLQVCINTGCATPAVQLS
jgi:hypothetical protein